MPLVNYKINLKLNWSKDCEFMNNLWICLKIFFLFFCVYKMYLISAEGYENAGVDFLRIKKVDDIWIKMKDVQDGLGVQNISDLVLKEN